MTKKRASQSHKSANTTNKMKEKKNTPSKQIPEEKRAYLEELFLMGGITPYQASRLVGIHHTTASTYYKEWSEVLVESEGHDDFVVREKRARAQALESITKTIIGVRKRRQDLERILGNLIYKKDEKDPEKFELKDVIFLEHPVILGYTSQIRQEEVFLTELQLQYDTIKRTPPVEAILDREVEKLIGEKLAQKNRINISKD